MLILTSLSSLETKISNIAPLNSVVSKFPTAQSSANIGPPVTSLPCLSVSFFGCRWVPPSLLYITACRLSRFRLSTLLDFPISLSPSFSPYLIVSISFPQSLSLSLIISLTIVYYVINIVATTSTRTVESEQKWIALMYTAIDGIQGEWKSWRLAHMSK